jgi:hypothetical protein
MKDNDIVTNDCPKSQLKDPTVDDHVIISIERNDNPITFRIPLMLKGTTSAIPVRRPTDEEFAIFELERFELAYETPADWWDHADPGRATMEAQLSEQSEFEERRQKIITIFDRRAIVSSTTHARHTWA